MNGFVDTGIPIKRGDGVIIRANGVVTFGVFAGKGGPEGISFNPEYNYFQNIPHGCLIGRVRNTLEDHGWAYIGKGTAWMPDYAGSLELNVNDKDPGNNIGQFKVEIIIYKAH